MFRKTLVGCVLFTSAVMLSFNAFADDVNTADQMRQEQINEAAIRDQARQAHKAQNTPVQTQTVQAPVQNTEWQTVNISNYAVETGGAKTSRIFSELGSAVAGAGITLGGSMMFAYAADHSVYEGDNGHTNDKKNSFYNALIAAAVVVPFVEAGLIHWSGEAMNSWGIGWTPYAGGAAGGALGAALGAIGFVDSKKTGSITTFIGSAVGAVIGAITWYEISNNRERAAEAAVVSNLHPTFEFNDEYTAVGVGFDF